MPDQLKRAFDNLGWTGQTDDAAWKDAAWEVFKAMRYEIERLNREVEALKPQENTDA